MKNDDHHMNDTDDERVSGGAQEERRKALRLVPFPTSPPISLSEEDELRAAIERLGRPVRKKSVPSPQDDPPSAA